LLLKFKPPPAFICRLSFSIDFYWAQSEKFIKQSASRMRKRIFTGYRLKNMDAAKKLPDCSGAASLIWIH
jgi:hypothetical protein